MQNVIETSVTTGTISLSEGYTSLCWDSQLHCVARWTLTSLGRTEIIKYITWGLEVYFTTMCLNMGYFIYIYRIHNSSYRPIQDLHSFCYTYNRSDTVTGDISYIHSTLTEFNHIFVGKVTMYRKWSEATSKSHFHVLCIMYQILANISMCTCTCRK